MHKSLGFVLVAMAGCGVFGAADEPPSEGPAGSPPPVRGTPTEEELTEKFGVFVSPDGTARGDGSRYAPLPSIELAIARAKDKLLRVYVCTGVYDEPFRLVSGVSVIGGYDCSNPNAWKPGAPRSRLEPSESPAIVARDIDTTTRLEGFDVTAGPGTDAQPSSIALLAENAGQLTIANTKLAAGRGFDGPDGAPAPQLTLNTTRAPGEATLQAVYTCPPFGVCMNLDGSYRTYPGGLGGVGACLGASGHDPESGGTGGTGGVFEYSIKNVLIPGWYPYQGYASDEATSGEPRSGSDGSAGVDGTSSAGELTPMGFTPGSGTAGTNGAPGKGGKGGDGKRPMGSDVDGAVWRGTSGSGGGAGGCPGLAGTPGKGGGASIGALLFDSPITLERVDVLGGDGGDGGAGAMGSESTSGQLNGPSASAIAEVRGASGGRGGRAGVSGSGSGGPSAGIAFKGAPVRIVEPGAIKAGNAGKGVPALSTAAGSADERTRPASLPGWAKDIADLNGG